MPVLDLIDSGGESSGGTCSSWADASDVDCGPCADYSFDPIILEESFQVASDILFDLTKRQWPGVCADVVRPGNECGCGADVCGCGWISKIRLPGFPVVTVDEVIVDGVVIPASRYEVQNDADLVYLPDPANPSVPIGAWPRRQRADMPLTENGTWQVAYTFGRNPPIGGVRAAVTLGCQLALACVGDDSCALPSGTVSVARQGVSISVIDPTTLTENGMTGLPSVDLWVASVLRGVRVRPGSIYVPGRHHPARRTT